ncbi:MAG: leucine-rich repeat domain-containing protein [Clostridiales bacterium]|nr:leucine-rich repeat domain-containing protein [Clostridiales bacterium]
MKKKFLLTLLAVVSVFACAFGLVACGNDNNNGNGHDLPPFDFRYEFTEDGSGLILGGYHGNDTEVVIPAEYNGTPIKEIDNSFNGNTTVTKVTIPDSVTVIGSSTFAHTVNLTEVVFPDNLTELGVNAFQDSGIKSVVLPSTVEKIGAQAFYKAKDLTEFKIADDAPLEELGNYTFTECSALKTVQLPDALKRIGQFVFKDCTNLESVDLKHVEIIDVQSFNGCVKLSSVDFGDSLKEIESNTFENTALESVILPDTFTRIGGRAFKDCSQLKTVYIPENTFMYGNVFEGCLNVETLTIPSGAERIEFMFALDGDTDDYSDLLPHFTTLHVIGTKQLWSGYGSNFTKLENITLDDRVCSVGAECFMNTAWYNNLPNGIVYLDNVVLGYKGDAPTGTLTFKEGTVCIADKAFTDCAEITNVEWQPSIRGIGYQAFSGCDITGEVTLPSSIKSYGDCCLKGNDKISKLTLVFAEDTTLRSLFETVPDALTEVVVNGSVLPKGALIGADYVTVVTLSDDITEISDSAFYGCDALSTVRLGGVTRIGKSAFKYCRAITDITIPDTVVEIDDEAFYGIALTTVTLGENVKRIGRSAFAYNGKLTTVVTNDKLEIIDDGAFNSCGKLTSINFGSALKTIGQSAFQYCSGLEEVKLNNGLQYIGQWAFAQTKLKSLVIPKTVTYVGAYVVEKLKTTDTVIFKLFVEAEAPDSKWDKYWNLNIAEYDKGEIIEGTENYYPTYYYSETDKPDDELSLWHYVDDVPTVWHD